MKVSFARLVCTALCSIVGLVAISDNARADYPMMTAYGYSSYYSPYSYSGYWSSGYSPFWMSSYYAPSYVSYAPACSTCSPCSTCGSACGPCGSCGPACGAACGVGCDSCGLACASGSCGIPNRAGKGPQPDPKSKNGTNPTYDPSAPDPNKDDKKWEGRDQQGAPKGNGDATKDGDADKQTTFKPVGPAPETIIPQRQTAPMSDPDAPKASLGQPAPTKPAAEAAPATENKKATEAAKPVNKPALEAPAAGENKESTPKTDDKPAAEKPEGEKKNDAEPPKTEKQKSENSPVLPQLNAKITWRVMPERTRLAPVSGKSTFGTLPIVRQTPRARINPNWVPVEQGQRVVQK